MASVRGPHSKRSPDLARTGGAVRGVRSLSGQAYSFFGWTSGGTWCWLNCFALWHLAGSSSRPELDAVIAVKESCRAGPHQTVHGLEETLASGHLGEVGRHAELHVGQILASAVDDRVQRVPGGQK